MADDQLRELERRFRASGSIDDERRWLGERLRAGTITRERLEVAAHAGHEAARAVLGAAPPPDDLVPWLEPMEARGLDVSLRATLAIARLVIVPAPRGGTTEPLWSVVEAAEAWLASPDAAHLEPLRAACAAILHVSVPLRVAAGGLSVQRSFAAQACLQEVAEAAVLRDDVRVPLRYYADQAIKAAVPAAELRAAISDALVRWALA